MSSHTKSPSVFSRRLKQARKNAGLTQFNLGVLAGIDEYTASARMNQYERGVHVPDVGTVTRLAKVLNIPVSFMYEPNDKMAELILQLGLLNARELKQLSNFLKDDNLSSLM
jgi:transcriptional regulator with XRE-family HTH domain